jgi:hypothetical protein
MHYCLTDKSKCKTEAGYVTDNATGACLFLSQIKKSWYNARLDCRARSGVLATIKTEAFHDVIRNQLQKNSKTTKHWIGLVNSQWKWTNGNMGYSVIVL